MTSVPTFTSIDLEVEAPEIVAQLDEFQNRLRRLNAKLCNPLRMSMTTELALVLGVWNGVSHYGIGYKGVMKHPDESWSPACAQDVVSRAHGTHNLSTNQVLSYLEGMYGSL